MRAWHAYVVKKIDIVDPRTAPTAAAAKQSVQDMHLVVSNSVAVRRARANELRATQLP
jgi:hypothetical protein